MLVQDELVQLRAENEMLRQMVASLQEQHAAALARIAELEQRRPPDPPSFVKPNSPKPESKPRRKRDPKHNHGRRYETPTRIEQHALDHCPDCHQHLHGGTLARKRQVIDLPPPPPVEVIEHHIIRRWCSWCRRWHAPKLDLRGVVLGQSRFSVRIASLVAYLRTTLRLPIRRIRSYLESLHQLTLSTGEITELLHQVQHETTPALDDLKREARASPVLHADETGWREAGQNGYVWMISTPDGIRVYEYDQSRAQGVATRLIGADYRGVLSTDFYGGYNHLACRHQRCWVHLLRDLVKLVERHGQDVRVRQWAVQLEATYRMAQQRLAQEPQLSLEERGALATRLCERVRVLGQQYAKAKNHPCRALAQRVLRHAHELFVFVEVEGVSADNNAAERSIRPVVVVRKISGGTKSAKGSRTRFGLASLFETWQARGLNPLEACLNLLSQTPLPQI
jgi:transposase